MVGAGMTIQDIATIRPGLLRCGVVAPARRSPHAERQPTDQDARKLTEFQLIFCVLGPFAFGYFLSYVFRTINALLAGTLSHELDIGPLELGLLRPRTLAVAAS